MSGPAIHDITLTRPGGTNPVTLPTNGVDASWVVRPQGTLSAEVVTADLLDALGTTRLANRYWIAWEDPTAGVWGGVVTATQPTKATGTTEIAARDFSELLAARVTAKVYDLPSIGAGGAARMLVFDAGRGSPTWITETLIDPMLPAVPFASRAENVLSAVNRLADEADAEWQVTAARVLRFVKRLGRDVSATRQLVEDRQIVDFSFPQTGDPVRNELLAIPADTEYARTTAVVVADGDSIRAEGLRQDTIVFEGMTTETQLKPAAQAALARRVNLGRSLTMTLAEDPRFDGDDPCHSWFVEGDTVAVLLPSVNFDGAVRIVARSKSTATGLLTVTCEVGADA